MKKLILFLCTITCCSQSQIDAKANINSLINNWHVAASNANFTTYFDLMTDDAVFIGTDATEHWNKNEFMAYAKPHFEKGIAWSFSSLERNVYFYKDNQIAWFDELLSTQMKICRGSGIVIKTKKGWRIAQYVLSMTVPNGISAEVIEIKSKDENELLDKLTRKQ